MTITRYIGGNVMTLRPGGRFDTESNRALRCAVGEAIGNASVSEIHVDLREVDYVDASTLASLVLSNEFASAAGKVMVLANAQDSVKQSMEAENFRQSFVLQWLLH